MHIRRYSWTADGAEHELRLVPVPGTAGTPFSFNGNASIPIDVRGFYMSSTPVTQALWTHVMGSNPAARVDIRCPVENVSWDHITAPDGFLDRINSNEIRRVIAGSEDELRFRLPSETEWEYAARGGPHWTDGFTFSGSNDPDEVAGYGPRWRAAHQLVMTMFGWPLGWRLANRLNGLLPRMPTRTHDVATKAPNQLGLYDMSGNVWEWCADACVDDPHAVPHDGTPWLGESAERRLRGGCHHNWDLHCTVAWRYGISPDSHDGCIGFRLALAAH
jgi:formylglycine-generating enzyme